MTDPTDESPPAAPLVGTMAQTDGLQRPAIEQPLWLIVNPNAGRKAGLTTNSINPDDAQRVLEQHGIPVTARLTERAGHATELAREAVAAGARTIVAAGGDGTVREVATGMINSESTLGILPLGSVMNVARSLNIPRDLEEAAEVIRAGRKISMDIGWAETNQERACFLEASGAGVDAGVFAYVTELDGGNWSSLPHLIRFVRRFRPSRIHLRIDDRDILVRACYTITVAIGPYTGAALTLAPDAKVNDRQFDIVVRQGFGRLEFLWHMVNIAWGGRERHQKANTFRGRRVEIDAPTRELFVHADGDMIGATPASFQIQPAALSVIVGASEPGEPSAVRNPPSEPTRPPADHRETPAEPH